jgi:hypothetical protein
MTNHKHYSGEHPDHPPVEGGYTGFTKDRMVPRYPEPKRLDPSRIGGLGHICGMFCDGQDRGGGCDVQDKYYGTKYPYTGQQAKAVLNRRRKAKAFQGGL